MINSIEIDESTAPEALRKLFRKKAMTGGGFIRLKSGLEPAQLQSIFERFLPELLPDNLAERVMVALAQVSELPAGLAAELGKLDNYQVKRALKKRSGDQTEPIM